MNKTTLISAFALLFTGLQCFSSTQSNVAADRTLMFHNVTVPPRAFNAKTYSGQLTTIAKNVVGLTIPTQDEALLNGWNFNDENRFSNGEIALHNDLSNPNSFGEVVVVVGAGPFQKTYPNNPQSKKMSQTYRVQDNRGIIHTLINGINLGKFEKKGIMLTAPSCSSIFTVDELDALTVSLPAGALPEPAPSPQLTHAPVIPLLGAIAAADMLNACQKWFSSETFKRGEIVFAYVSDEATLGIFLEEDVQSDCYKVQVNQQGKVIAIAKKSLARIGTGAIAQKTKK